VGTLRWRRHRHLLGLTAIILLVLVVLFGDVRIAAITSRERHAAEPGQIRNIAGGVDLFDDSVVHEIALTFDPNEYDDLIAAYQSDGEKAFIEASVTIDGTTIDQVGIRLKGNSTLMGLRRDGPFGGDRPGRMAPPSECVAAAFGGAAPPPEAFPSAAAPVAGEGSATPVAARGFAPGSNQFGGNISADDPSTLPLLISFDEIVAGQRYQGLSDIAVRPVLANTTMLNEALALRLIGAAGEPTQRAAYSSVIINGRDAALRLILEVPGDAFAERSFTTNGVLYKALSTGQFDYLGDDPTLYETAFDQETAKNHQDLKPVIDLLKWVATASDEAFAEQLDRHVDVASLARYIALQELLDNFDDMAGPGKNYYLWYDLETRRFTVLTWDLNLALSEFPGPGRGLQGPRGEAFDFEAMIACVERVRGDAGGDDAGGFGRGMRMGHPLKDRFLATPAFQELYAREYAAVYEALYGSGQALSELERLTAVVRSNGLLDAATVTDEVSALRGKLEAQAGRGPVARPADPPGSPPSSPAAGDPAS
jgi:spore coat protein CotH